MLDEPVARTLEERFESDLAWSTEITLAGWNRRTRVHRVGDQVARALSPVL
jgi:hypothetical protein